MVFAEDPTRCEVHDVVCVLFQESAIAGSRDALKALKGAAAAAATDQPRTTLPAAPHVKPGAHATLVYNVSKVKRAPVTVPLETCSLAQQPTSPRDVQVSVAAALKSQPVNMHRFSCRTTRRC